MQHACVGFLATGDGMTSARTHIMLHSRRLFARAFGRVARLHGRFFWNVAGDSEILPPRALLALSDGALVMRYASDTWTAEQCAFLHDFDGLPVAVDGVLQPGNEHAQLTMDAIALAESPLAAGQPQLLRSALMASPGLTAWAFTDSPMRQSDHLRCRHFRASLQLPAGMRSPIVPGDYTLPIYVTQHASVMLSRDLKLGGATFPSDVCRFISAVELRYAALPELTRLFEPHFPPMIDAALGTVLRMCFDCDDELIELCQQQLRASRPSPAPWRVVLPALGLFDVRLTAGESDYTLEITRMGIPGRAGWRRFCAHEPRVAFLP
jgi:hypothetical protein